MKEQIPFRPYQLENYMDAIWAEGFLNKHEVNLLSSMFDKGEKKQAEISGDVLVEPELRKSKVVAIEPGYEEFKDIMLRLGQLVLQINAEHYRFDLMGFYEPIQLAEYSKDDFFDWHADFGNGSASIRKLSMSVQLSHPAEYSGGDLQFMIHKKGVFAPRTQGTVVIFPSFVPHRVTSITSGKRRSMVGWVSGIPYR